MPRVIKARYKLRSGTTAEWTANDEVLAAAEVGEEVTPTGERLRKVGDGTSKWSELPYRVNDPVDRTTDPTEGQTLAFNASTGLLEWRDAGKTYQAGRNIVIDDANTATPTINSDAGLQIDNRVDLYTDLAGLVTSVPLGAGDAGYTVLCSADGLLYVWDGSAWPNQGEGLSAGGGGGMQGSSSKLRSKILSASPQLYLPMEPSDISGTTALDASGNGYDFTFPAGISNTRPLIPGDDVEFPFITGATIRSSGIGIPSPWNFSITVCAVFQRFATTYGWDSSVSSLGLFNHESGELESTNYQLGVPHNISGSQNGLAFWEYGSGHDQSPGENPGNYGASCTEPCIIHIVKDSSAKTIVAYKNGRMIDTPAGYSHEPSGTAPQYAEIGSGGHMYMGHYAFFKAALSESQIQEQAKAAGFFS